MHGKAICKVPGSFVLDFFFGNFDFDGPQLCGQRQPSHSWHSFQRVHEWMQMEQERGPGMQLCLQAN